MENTSEKEWIKLQVRLYESRFRLLNENLNRRLGLPAGLREMGLDPALVSELAVAATRDHCAATNPRPAEAADYEALLREALG